jgi:hypothetical protein
VLTVLGNGHAENNRIHHAAAFEPHPRPYGVVMLFST